MLKTGLAWLQSKTSHCFDTMIDFIIPAEIFLFHFSADLLCSVNKEPYKSPLQCRLDVQQY